MLLLPFPTLLILALGGISTLAHPSLSFRLRQEESITPVSEAVVNGKTYSYVSLVGQGFIANNARDAYGDTLGGIGSAIALEPGSWKADHVPTAEGGALTTYTGVVRMLSDRGWNTQGTLNYVPRLQRFEMTFNLSVAEQAGATVATPQGPNVWFRFLDETILLRDAGGNATTGLDADNQNRKMEVLGKEVPTAFWLGDGFRTPEGGDTEEKMAVALDPEGIVMNEDGSFWVSEEYGCFIYLFDADGTMITVLPPPDAVIPRRDDVVSFSSNDEPMWWEGGKWIRPKQPDTGRNNNDGIEGLASNPERTRLWALLQGALNQDDGNEDPPSPYVRMLEYDITNPLSPVYLGFYVVPFPSFTPSPTAPDQSIRPVRQSALLHVGGTQFLVLSRDDDCGNMLECVESAYKSIDVLDIDGATLLGEEERNCTCCKDCACCSVLKKDGTGELKEGVKTVRYEKWLDMNDNAQLERFMMHNGGERDRWLLNEKWESLLLLPVHPNSPDSDGDFFLLSVSDNDFITQDGYLDWNRSKFTYREPDEGGIVNKTLDTQALLFRVRIPTGLGKA